MNKQIFLFLIIICSISYSQSLQTPTPLSPGKLYPQIESIGSDKLTFTWKSVEDIDGYAFVITEYDGKGYFNLIYNSRSSGNINDTTFSMDNKIFKQNSIYRWKVRSLKDKQWSSYSEKLLFQVKKVQEAPQIPESVSALPLPAPTPLSPGKLSPEIDSVDTYNLTFTWESVAETEGYSFVITEFDGKGYFNLIYNSRPAGIITDTTFTLDNKILKHNNIYRWKVRSLKDKQWSSYSEKLMFKVVKYVKQSPSRDTVPDTDLETTPERTVIVSPERYGNEEESITDLPVRLTWNKSYGASEYAVNVYEFQVDGEYKLIYNSQKDKTVTDTTITLPVGILKQGLSYKWNYRAFNSSGWSVSSESRYFKIVPIEKLPKPEPTSPGALTERSRADINTLTPNFSWHSVEGSSFYNVIISRKSLDGSYSEIYNNASIPNNEFQLSDDIIRDGKIYKWSVRALIDTQWTEFSKDLFFSPLIQPELDITSQTITTGEPEEVFLSIKYAGVLNGMVTSIFYKDKVYLPVSEVFTSLEINNNVDHVSNLVTGNFVLPELKYKMDFQKDSIYFGDSVYSFTDDDVIDTEIDYYISTEIYKEVFGINFELDFSNLALKIHSDVDLPILSRNIREANYSFIEGIREIGRPEVNFGRNRSMFNFGLFDYQITAAVYNDNKPNGQYNFGLGGEVLGGDLSLAARGNYSGSDFSNTDLNYKWRYVFEKEKYITSVSGGYINSDQGLENFNYKGVKVTNEPVEPRRGYSTYRIFDVTSPNWTVELYISNQLVDIARADAAGNFHFDIPLSYGTTLVQLKYYGPGGEFYTADKVYQTPFLLLKPGEFNYALNLGEIPFTKQRLANVYGGYGLNDWLTNKTGIDYIENSNGDTPVIYNSTTARVDGNYLLNLTLAPNAFYSLSANALYYDQTSIDVSYTNYQNQGFYNISDLKHEVTGNLFVPIKFNKWQLNIQSNLTYKKSDFLEAYETLLGVGVILSGFNPFINYRYSDFNFTNQYTSLSVIDAGFSWSIYKLPTFLLFMRGNILSARTYYNTDKKQFESISASFSTNIFSNTRMQISHTNNLLNNSSQTQLQLIVFFPFTQYAVQYSGDALSQTLLGSIGYDHNHQSLKFYPRPLICRAAVSFLMFVDDNANGKYDFGEEIIKDAKVSMGTSVFQLNEDGLINAYELNPYTQYTVRVVEESIKNPLLIPKHKVFGIVTDPNNFKTIEIPFYIAGEISGYLYRQVGGVRTILSGVKLHIVHIESLEDDFKTQVSSFYNGSFYYFGLKPGKYKVYIDPDQLEALNVSSSPAEMIIDVKADPYGDYIDDLIFVVE